MNSSAKTALRVLGIFGAVIFSILLVVLMIVAPLYSATTSITDPDTIVSIIRNIDYTDFLLSEEILGGSIEDTLTEDVELPEEVKTYILPIVQSPVMDDVVSVYVEDVLDTFRGEQADFRLTPQVLESIVDEHMDTIVTLIQENAPEGTVIDTAKAQNTVRNAARTYGDKFIDALPAAETIRGIAEDFQSSSPATVLIEPSVLYVLYGVIALLAVFVFFCRFEKLKGLLWLGIDALIASLPLFLVFAVIGDGTGIADALSVVSSVGAILLPTLSILSNKTMIGAIVLAVAGVLFIAGFITYTVVKNKRAAAALAPALAETQQKTL